MTLLLESINLFPHYLYDWCGCFLASRRERLMQLLLGSPAILVALLVVYSAWVSPGRSASLVQNLIQEAVQSLENEDFERVGFLIKRIRSSGRIPSGLECQLALACEKRGDLAEAERLMKSVARDRVPERPHALKWLSIRILQGEPTVEELQEAEEFLSEAVRQVSNDAQAHWLLAQVYVRQEKFEEATKHLDLLAPYDYRASLLGAEVHKRLGHAGQAKLAVQQTLRLLDKLPVEEQSAATARAHGECLFFLQRDQEAIGILEAAMEKYQDPSFKFPLYIAYLKSASKMTDSSQKLSVLEKALQLAPGNPLVLAQISNLALQDPAKSAEAVRKLEEALNQGQSTAAMHFVLGTNASMTGKSSDAVEHLRTALESASVKSNYGPPVPGGVAVTDAQRRKTEFTRCMIKNNLAWTLAHAESPDLDQALKLTNEVCELFPDVHTFRETRGQIYAKQARWKEAIDDLTFAMEGMPKHAPLHATLARAYQETGNKYGALRHTRLAQESRAKVQ